MRTFKDLLHATWNVLLVVGIGVATVTSALILSALPFIFAAVVIFALWRLVT